MKLRPLLEQLRDDRNDIAEAQAESGALPAVQRTLGSRRRPAQREQLVREAVKRMEAAESSRSTPGA